MLGLADVVEPVFSLVAVKHAEGGPVYSSNLFLLS